MTIAAAAIAAAIAIAPASSSLPSVSAESLTDAYVACYLAYADHGRTDIYIDCVNAADLYFEGRGHHSRMYNV